MGPKPVLDEASFERLLEAAFVVQQHNAQQRAISNLSAPNPKADFNELLAEIVETQTLIQLQQLDLSATMQLVAERAQSITGASGTLVAMLDQGEVSYPACAGAWEEPPSPGPLASAFSAECLRRGKPLEVADVPTDERVPRDLRTRTLTRSLLAVPILREGRVGGALELHFEKKNEFHQHEVRTCQLLAGLISEGMNRAAEQQWKRAMEADRASVLDALEKLKPQLERLTAQAAPVVAASPSAVPEPVPQEPAITPSNPAESTSPTPTSASTTPGPPPASHDAAEPAKPQATWSSSLQSKWASAWKIQNAMVEKQAAEPLTAEAPTLPFTDPVAPSSAGVSQLPLVSGIPAASVAEEPASEPEQTPEVSARSEAMAQEDPALPPHAGQVELIFTQKPAEPVPAVPEEAEASILPPAIADADPPFVDTFDELEVSPSETVQLEDPALPPLAPYSEPPVIEAPAQTLTAEPAETEWSVSPPATTGTPGSAASELHAAEPPAADTVFHEDPAPRFTPILSAAQPLAAAAPPALDDADQLRQVFLQAKAAPKRRNWQQTRANFYLLIAILLFGFVLVSWFTHSLLLRDDSRSGVSAGDENSEAQVWADVPNARYFCVGEDGFGKTAGGKVMTQEQARQANYRPASQNACK